MNLRSLTHFRCAYETKSYSQAAAMIPMSPQGLARSIHRLEDRLGVPLFTAGKGSDERIPTPYADVLVRYAYGMETQYEMLLAEIERLRLEETGVIRLYAAQGSSMAFGVDFVDRYERSHQPATIIVQEAGDYACDDALLGGRCEIAFTKDPFNEAFETVELGSERIFYWVNRNSDLASKSSIGVADLEGRDFALLDRSLKIHDVVYDALERQGVRPRKITRSIEIYYIYNYVLQGGEIGMTTEGLAYFPAFMRSEDVVAIPSEEFRFAIGVSRLRLGSLPDHVMDFYEYCANNLRF